MESAIKRSAWYETASSEFFKEVETDAALRVLQFIATLGLTQEQAVETTKRAYALSQLDCVQSKRVTPYSTVHVNKENIDFEEYFNIRKIIP